MCPIPYYEMIRQRNRPEYWRLRVVQVAREEGIKPAARIFGVTVRKWVRRFDGSRANLRDRSRAPHRRPRRMSRARDGHIVKLKRRLPTGGAERLRREFTLPCAAKAIRRVCRAHGLIRPR